MKILEWFGTPGQLSFVRAFFLLPLREPIMRGAEEEGVIYCTTIGHTMMALWISFVFQFFWTKLE